MLRAGASGIPHECRAAPPHCAVRSPHCAAAPLPALAHCHPPAPPPTAAAEQKGFGIGRECPTCLRGAIATKDLKAGDTILKIPFSAVLRLKWVLA